MIGKLFNRFCLLSLVLAFAIGANAQTTINTNYTSATIFGNAPQVGSSKMCVTFSVTNGNSYPIIITQVSQYHMSSVAFNSPWPSNVSNNGATYELWETSASLTGTAIVNLANGWQPIDTTANYSAAGNGIAPIFQNTSILIPPNATRRYAVVIDDTLAVNVAVNGTNLAPTSPKFFSSNGVVLTSATNAYLGTYPNANQYGDTIGFWGGIEFASLKPPIIQYAKYKVCLNDDLEIEATADPYYQNPTFTWYKGTSTTPIFVGSKLKIDSAKFSDSGTYRVEVTGTNTNFTSSQTILTVEVVDPPAPVVTGKFNYCLNEPFEHVTVLGGQAKWYYTPTGGSPIPVVPTINTSTPNVLVHYVSVTDALGCESSERTQVIYKAAPKPAPPIVTTPVYYCEDVPAEQVRAIGDTLQWYYQEVAGIPTTIAPTPNTSKLDSFQYWVSQKIDGCESERNRIDVVVTFRPNGQILLDQHEICVYDTVEVNYYGSAFPGSGYLWTLPEGTSSTNGGLDQGPIQMRLDSPGMQKITLRVGHTGCFSDLYVDSIGVKPRPTGTILSKDDLCLNQSDLIGMQEYTKTTDDFAWDFDGGTRTHFTTDQGPYGVHWGTAGWKTISVVLTDSGCTTTVIDSVLIHEKPDATIVAEYARPESYGKGFGDLYSEGDSLCSDDSLKVSVNTIDISAKYQWSPSLYFKANTTTPVTYARVNRSDTIVLRVEDEFGCYNTDSLYIPTSPCCEIFFPNAFTPNNDGHNDFFRPITIGNREMRTFRVVNRYGQTVFETTNPVQGWDGTLNGEKLDLGTYFYLVSYVCGGKVVDQAGEVILIR